HFGSLKIPLIPLAARGATHPFPDVIATLEQPFERVRTEHSTEFISDSEDSGFQRSRIFKRQLQRFVFLPRRPGPVDDHYEDRRTIRRIYNPPTNRAID